MLALNFAFTAMNAGIDDTNIHPAALASVIGIGIAKTDKLNSLSVDAAIANPAPTTMRKPRVKKLSYG